eukprot:TCONS_00005269-protein
MIIKKSLALLFFVYHVTGLQITRSKEGDRVPGVFCEEGTLIFRDDETHSLQCITQMHEAGCMLSFFDSRKVKCVEKSGINEYHVIPRNVQTFCSDGHQVSPGKIQLQNYPTSIKASVWYTGHGVEEVAKGIQYVELQNTQVIFRIKEYWPGFVMKLNFVCKNASGHITEKSDENCVILKNVGFTPYPLEQHTFIPTPITPPTTTAASTAFVTASNGDRTTSNNDQTKENHQSLVKPFFSHDELIFALLCAFGLAFIIVSICLTLLCIRRIRRQKFARRSKTGEGNEAFVAEEAIDVVIAREEAIDVVVAREEAIQISQPSPEEKKKKKKILRRKKTKEKPALHESPSPTRTKETPSNETPPPTTSSSRLHFSPMVSTDSNRLSYSQPSLINATESDGASPTKSNEGLGYGETRNRTHSGDITVTDDVLNHYGSTTPRGFKESLLHQFTNDQHNVFHNNDNDCDDEHDYAQVHDRLSHRDHGSESHVSPHGKSNHESPHSVHSRQRQPHTKDKEEEEHFQDIDEHSGFDQQHLYATVIRKKPDSGRKTLSELRHLYSSASDNKTSSGSQDKNNEDEDEITIDLDANTTEENSINHRQANETTITLDDNNSVNQGSYYGDVSSTNEDKDNEQAQLYSRSSLKKANSRAALWERGHVQSPIQRLRDSKGESPTRNKSVKQMWQERDSINSQDSKFSSPFRKKKNTVSSRYNRNKNVPASPKMSIRDIWQKRVEENSNASPTHSINRNSSNASRQSVPASVTSMSVEDFVNEDGDQANVDMSESIEAMFDMGEDGETGVEETEEESFADILRKQMMF